MDRDLLLADLDAFAADSSVLDEQLPIDDVELPIDTSELRDLANKLLRKHRRLAEDASAIEDVAEREHRRIDAWVDDRLAGVRRENDRVETLLDQLMRSYKQATNGKTLVLPNGELRLRASRERFDVVDEEAFVAWARAAQREDELVRVKRSADKTALARAEWGKELSVDPLDMQAGMQRWHLYDPATGERVDGVVCERSEQPSFSVSSSVKGTDDE